MAGGRRTEKQCEGQEQRENPFIHIEYLPYGTQQGRTEGTAAGARLWAGCEAAAAMGLYSGTSAEKREARPERPGRVERAAASPTWYYRF